MYGKSLVAEGERNETIPGEKMTQFQTVLIPGYSHEVMNFEIQKDMSAWFCRSGSQISNIDPFGKLFFAFLNIARIT
jgi:hypothetical protein